MAGKSDYLEGKVLDHLFGITPFSAPATLYAGLFTATPSDAGGGTEVAGGSYARQAITNDNTKWSRTGNVISNISAVDFPAATAVWGTVDWVGIFDALIAGNLLYWAPLLSARTINISDQVGFAPGQLQFTED
jgi:hypothetical protein